MEKYKATTDILKINLVVKNCWWFSSQYNKERGETWGKICMKTNESRIQPNQWKITSGRQKF